jgi:hypothetical protein
MGQHWIAIYIDANSRGEYYDPTGRKPHESPYVKFMNKHIFQEPGDVCHDMSSTSMNEVKNATKFAHGRSFFLYSNGIVNPMKAMFVHKKKRRLMQPLYRASHKPGLMKGDLLLGDLGDQMYHFIHLTLRLYQCAWPEVVWLPELT